MPGDQEGRFRVEAAQNSDGDLQGRGDTHGDRFQHCGDGRRR